ncbi:MAG: hypothetical protein ACD_71C00209G0003 [uncultured bacterium (gcode 4)]|uniref:Uncharacterized protein n=1 Tax=uncultured bacterium (gcode 4) TaxID=1234023 RepID=K1Z4P7_9BACT|nr:MAG: hypothetical protein ACD_71C00209G0003 [uncultured bacterium (gcode 4)]
MNNRLQIKDFKIALKDFERIVKTCDKYWRSWLINGNNLEKKTDNIPIEWGWYFCMRYRESWANWLLCAVFQNIGINVTFAESNIGDWIILDKNTGIWIITEHVAAMDFNNGKTLPKWEERIIQAIKEKIKKGEEYARGKRLVVFLDGADKWYPDKVWKVITSTHNFESIYCVWLLVGNNDGYTYSISQFSDNHSPTYLVHINSDFTNWRVERIQ